MSNILKRLNFILGIFFVFISIFIGKILEDIARSILKTMYNFFAFWGGPGSGGYIDLFYESFVVEALGTAVYSGVAIFGPILIFEKFFNKIKINWLPSIILLSIFFLGFLIISLIDYFTRMSNLDFVENLQVIVMLLSYTIGAFMPLILAMKHLGFKYTWLNKFD